MVSQHLFYGVPLYVLQLFTVDEDLGNEEIGIERKEDGTGEYS